MREHFGTKPEVPDLLHNRDVCRMLNIGKRTLQHYRDTSVLPFIQIGHKCYYKREDVEALLAKFNHKKQ
nr:helix-turn-helix domain-containing protein [Porphyromonas macacae]